LVEAFILLYRAVRKLILEPLRQWTNDVEVILQLRELEELGPGVNINGPLRLDNPRNVSFGEDVCINPGFTVRGPGRLRIGSHVHIGMEVRVMTGNHNYDDPMTLPYDKNRIPKDVSIGDCVWIGDRVLITPGVTVGDGAVLGAGAVVAKDVEPLAVVGGSPARVLKHRNSSAYDRLREQGDYLNWPRDFDLVNRRKVRFRRKRVVQVVMSSEGAERTMRRRAIG
jgi:acetyltransferase-like isoleucine patch superfamily enzyme